MKCPKCHADNPDGSEFCSLCFTRFQVQLRAQETDDAARRIKEGNLGARLRCPSCESLSPIESQFCLRCGFIFDDIEELLVSEEEISRINDAAEGMGAATQGAELAPPMEITPESDGAEVMRKLGQYLEKGMRPRVQVRGRNAVTYAMKVIALLNEDLQRQGVEIRSRVELVSEGTVTHLDDVALDIVLERV